MTNTDRRVLKIPRSLGEAGGGGGGGDYVLLYVCRDRDGSLDLDLKLIATEGNNPYVGSVKGKSLSRLRAKNYHESEEEWEAILSLILLRKSPRGQTATSVQGLEVFASVTEDELTITIRKNIGGITQRLGNISLQQDESQEIELFDWTGLAAQAAIEAEDEKKSLETQLEARDEAIKQLNNQLADLIKAKEEHENALLEKFSELLNSKKLKIRDQQRLLRNSKVDSDEAAEVQSTRATGRARKAAPSRARKRKAKVDESPDPPQEPNVDKMDLNGITDEDEAPANESTSPQNTPTPEPSDSETADDESERQETPPPAPSGMKGKLFESGDPKKNVLPARASPPPRRELPFEKQSITQAQPESALPAARAPDETHKDGGEQSAGETDDDEL